MLIVGAGEVGFEKLHFILKSSPNAKITLIAPEAKEDVFQLINSGKFNINWIQKKFDPSDIVDHKVVIAATNFPNVNLEVYHAAKEKLRIINIADTPHLCDFYMGSIVTRGDLKVALSSNGKSPTLIKRFRQLLESVLPNSTHDLLNNLHKLRDTLEGDFEYKVNTLNDVTKSLIAENEKENS